jgi:hypothetical protein
MVRMGQIGFKLLFFFNPRELSPGRLWRNFSGFYSVLSRKPKRSRPLPTDLTTLVPDETEPEEEAKNNKEAP